MKSFLKRLFVFVLLGFLVGEIIARFFVLTTDVPRRMIDEFGIQKYIPNQDGNFKGGTHQWTVNEKGWVGELPNDYKNLITIIGDSYIENFMNPEECHQYWLLNQKVDGFNFMEGARSGVSFIESLEIAKQFEKHNPKLQLIYLSEKDLHESISKFGLKSDRTQIDLDKEEVLPGKLKSAKLKMVLYNLKFLYYLYMRFQPKPEKKINLVDKADNGKLEAELSSYYGRLFDFGRDNYHNSNVILVFRPETQSWIIELAMKKGFKTLHLSVSGEASWSFEHDSHWTCFGHRQAADQVAERLKLLP